MKIVIAIIAFILGSVITFYLQGDQIEIKKVMPFPISQEFNLPINQEILNAIKEDCIKDKAKLEQQISDEVDKEVKYCWSQNAKLKDQLAIAKQFALNSAQYKITAYKCLDYQKEISNEYNRCQQQVKELQNSINICYAQCK